jgi:FMN phosphatase YigB (HAD superfamily)
MLFIFGCDDTLLVLEDGKVRRVFEETMAILMYLRFNNHDVALASHEDCAYEILKATGLDTFFTPNLIFGFDHVSKRPHLEGILLLSGYAPSDAVFFDNLEFHIKEAEAMGIRGYCADYLQGLSLKTIMGICGDVVDDVRKRHCGEAQT